MTPYQKRTLSPIAQRMAGDMCVRNLSQRTIDAYTYHVERFARFFDQSLDQLGPEEIRTYQLHLIEERKASWSAFNQAVCGLRFLYRVTLPRPWVVQQVPFGKRPKRLPSVLGSEEVSQLLACVPLLKHRTILLTLYAAGLRLSEASHLRLADIHVGFESGPFAESAWGQRAPDEREAQADGSAGEQPGPGLRVIDLLRQYTPAYLDRFGRQAVPQVQSVLAKLALCRTSALGGHTYECPQCQHRCQVYNSCLDRHCPLCGGGRRADWLDKTSELLLTKIDYFQVVFTLPDDLWPLMLGNRRPTYRLLFHAAWEALGEVLREELGCEPAALMVLHTWNQRLEHYPHLHALVRTARLPSGLAATTRNRATNGSPLRSAVPSSRDAGRCTFYPRASSNRVALAASVVGIGRPTSTAAARSWT
jgi:hypothetical protein